MAIARVSDMAPWPLVFITKLSGKHIKKGLEIDQHVLDKRRLLSDNTALDVLVIHTINSTCCLNKCDWIDQDVLDKRRLLSDNTALDVLVIHTINSTCCYK